MRLERISIKGFKSIRELDLPLDPLNVLIGANGAGKSNFIGVFKLLNEIVNENLQLYVGTAGGADQLLYFGRQRTERIEIGVWFIVRENLANAYKCSLIPAAGDKLIFESETTYFMIAAGIPDLMSKHLAPGIKKAILEPLRKAMTALPDMC